MRLGSGFEPDDLGEQAATTSRRPAMRSFRAVAVVVAITVLLFVSAAPAFAARYVGLGDSAASGPVIPNQIPAPLGCWRSDHNFAHVVAQSLGVSLKDVSCGARRTSSWVRTRPSWTRSRRTLAG
jgi:hypothetical protein